ncbi:MAG: hypothetical protein J0H88_03130 [Sphingomonadales bacterium]|nr:hypothetical protein [Sphingomonadales bacterium]
MPASLNWLIAILAMLGGTLAFYLSSRHQRLLREPPRPRLLRAIQLGMMSIAYAALCQLVTGTTALFILFLLAMSFCTYLPLLVAGFVEAGARRE